MTTSVMLTFLILILTTMTCISTNPVKVSMILIVLSGSIFLNMKMSDNTWFPVLFFLIFMGGILMMFMILSSVLPNEKSKTTKKMVEVLMVMVIVSWGVEKWDMQMQAMSVKAFLQSSHSFVFLTLIMIMYFFCSIKTVSEENSSLRSVYCHMSDNFVNHLGKWHWMTHENKKKFY